MKKFLIAAVAVATLGLAISAQAADFPTKARAPMVAPPFNWTGVYLGINGGYGWGETTGDLWPVYAGGNNYDVNGGLFGGQIGFNYQFAGVPLVVGIEADWDWASIKGSQTFVGLGPFNTNTKLDNLGTVRGRIGYAWDRIMLYGTGGWAWSSRATADCGTFCLPGQTVQSHTLGGYTVGGGLEYGITGNLSVKAEYLYVHLTPTDFFANQSLGPLCTTTCSLGANVNVARLGLNWRFTGFP